jgi:hypothetical protein
MICTAYQLLFEYQFEKENGGPWSKYCGRERVGLHAGSRWGNLKKRDHMKDLDVDGELVLE